MRLLEDMPAGWFVRLAFLRLITQWRSILTLIVGVLLTVVIGASVPLYTDAIAQVGLVQRLEQRPPDEVNLFTRVTLPASGEMSFAQARESIDTAAVETFDTAFARLGDWHAHTVQWAETVTMLVQQNDTDLDGVRVRLAHYSDIAAHVEIVAGTWPDDDRVPDEPVYIAIPERVALLLDLSPGDRLTIDQRGRDSSLPFPVEVSAIFRPFDATAAYWMDIAPLRFTSNAQWRVESNVFVSRAALNQVAASYVPETSLQLGWRVLFDHSRLAFGQLDAAQSALESLPKQLQASIDTAGADDTGRLLYQSRLDAVLAGYAGEITRLGAPFGLLLLQLGALVLFFMIVISVLVRRSERRELTMLKSRGVTNRQLLALRGVETLIICLLMTLIAPFVARQLLVWLVPLFTGVDRLPLDITAAAYLYAGLAAAVTLVILVATLIPVLNAPLVLAQGHTERQQGQTWWQRYYLDVVMLVIAFAAMLQILNQDSLFAESDGEALTDPLLLLAPTLLVFALGSVSLRLFPLLLNAIQSGLRRVRSLEPALASWQVSREPLHYGRITFLLALAISIGWFALSFQRTIADSLVDQAAYRAGADLRVTLAPVSSVPPVTALGAINGVESAAPVLRLTQQDISTRSGSFNTGDVLAVDSTHIAQAAGWRDDLGLLVAPKWTGAVSQTGLPLPFVPESLALSVRYRMQSLNFQQTVEAPVVQPELLATQGTVVLRIRDADGETHLVELAANESSVGDSGGWVTFRAEPSALATLPAPLAFEGFIARIRDESSQFQVRIASELRFRDLTILAGDESATLNPFADMDAWTIRYENGIDTSNDFPLADDEAIDPALAARSLTVPFFQDDNEAQLALLYNLDETVAAMLNSEQGVPVLVSRRYATDENLTIGQRFNIFIDQTSLWFVVADVIDYYPTLYDDERSFIVMDLRPLLQTLGLRSASRIQTNELWFALNEDASPDAVVARLAALDDGLQISETVNITVTRRGLEADLLSVGLSGLLFFSSLMGFVLSSVSLLTYTSLSIQSRSTEFAVLRAIGLTTRRVMYTLAIEQALVIGVALLLGLGIGLLLSVQVLPVLSTNTAGAGVTPPFLVEIDIDLLGQYTGAILLLVAVQIGMGALLVRRLATSQALRVVGE